MGTPVVASADGTVIRAGWDNMGYGWMVWIEHDNGYKTLYAHLSRYDVDAGQIVRQGQLIGLSGNSGNSLGPHLHFEISLNGAKQNVMRLLP
jgi:murein DD-endopeptidase MepM/ murein hydrolase activator NlpD